MAAVAGMAVRVSAKTAGFRKGMKRSEGVITRFGKTVVGVSKQMVRFGAATAALAAGALVLLVKRSFASGDALAKMSDMLGIATEKLIGLQFAAQITGGSVESLNKSMQFLAKTIGEAKTGIGEGIQAFKALGIELDELEGMTLDETLIKLAGKFEKLTSQVDQAFVATKLFGRAGFGMINMLNLGAEGMRELIAETEALGINLSRIDLAKLEMANDAITRMKAIFKGFVDQLAAKLAPLVKALTDDFIDMAKAGGGAAEIIGEAFDKLQTKLVDVADTIALISVAWNTFTGVVRAPIAGLADLGTRIQKQLKQALIDAGGMPSEALESSIRAWENVTESFADAADKNFAKAGDAWNDFVNEVHKKRIGDYLKTAKAQGDRLAKEIADAADERREKGEVPGGQADLVAKALDATKKINSLLKSIAVQSENIGKTAAEIKILRLEKLGATPEQIKSAQALLTDMEARRDALKEPRVKAARALADVGGAVSGFQQVALSRVAIGGQRTPKNPQIEKTNELLQRLIDRQRDPAMG